MLGPGEGRDGLAGLFAAAKDSQDDGQAKRSKDEPPLGKVSSRELNPYLRDGGSGLPPGAVMLTRPGRFARPSTDDDDDTKEPTTEKRDVQADDEDPRESVMRMVREERVQKTSPLDRQMALRIARKAHFRDLDDLEERFRPSASPASASASASSSHEHQSRKRRMTRTPDECRLCRLSERADASDELLAVGNHTFLCLAKDNYLDPLHCLIVPIEHVPSFRSADEEDLWDEVRNFKKCLLSLADAIERPVIFLETATRIDSYSPHHALIHCIFLPRQVSTDPRTYFRKALQECDEEWAQHTPVIDTAVKGGLRKSIPRNFPYCYVDFRLDQGLVHVIEDHSKVRHHLLLELTAKLMGLEQHQWRRRHDTVSSEAAATRRDRFKRLFQPFDWTKLLHQAQ